MHYKKRCGIAQANLQIINYRRDVDDMVQSLASERKIRMVLTKDREQDRIVSITPLKRPRERESESDDESDHESDDEDGPIDYGSVNAYKDWLQNKGSATGIHMVVFNLTNHNNYNCTLLATHRSTR